ncbi:eh domain-containing protein 1, partial [Nannochloropsis oceanica]
PPSLPPSLPPLHPSARNSAMRKINELVKRTRLLRVHAYIIGYLKEQMPMFMGREKMQERLLRDLPSVFRNVLKQHHLAPGDFPDLDNFRNKLLDLNFSKFPKQQQPSAHSVQAPIIRRNAPAVGSSTTRGPSPLPPAAEANPFDDDEDKEGKEGSGEEEPWALADKMMELAPIFASYAPSQDGFLSGSAAKKALVETGVDKKVLRELWTLADMDKDGLLDLEEFTVAMQLIDDVRATSQVPDSLPAGYVPSGKRAMVA